MSYKVLHEKKDGILHVTAGGLFNTAQTVTVWQEVFDLALSERPQGMLLEITLLADRISMDHCFELIERLPLLSTLLGCKIAILCGQPSGEAAELLKFIETAARDRGANVKLFGAPDDARFWLKK